MQIYKVKFHKRGWGVYPQSSYSEMRGENKMEQQTKNKTLTKKEFQEIRKLLVPLQNRLYELSITYQDEDINGRLEKARDEVSKLVTELWYNSKN